MFVVIYRGSVYPDRQQEYRTLWKDIVEYFVKYRGALGSALHQTSEGEYLAYSRWPDRATRDASWGDALPSNLPPEIQALIAQLKACFDETKPHEEIQMCLLEDRLLPQIS